MKKLSQWAVPLVMIGAMCVTALNAQERMLTLEESLNLGIRNSTALHASEMKTRYAEAKSSEAEAGLYPSVKLQMSYQKLSSVPAFSIPISAIPGGVTFPVILNNYINKASVQQPLFTGWRLQSMADAADAGVQASQSDFRRDRAELMYSITAAYWNLYRAKEVYRISMDNVKQMEHHLNDIEHMSAQGMATSNEVLKTKVQLANARLMNSDAENAITIAMLFFNSVVGLPLSTQIGIATPLTSVEQEYPAVDQLLTSALRSRPEIDAMQWRIRAAESGVTAAKAGWMPQIFLTGNYYYSRPNQRIFPAKDAFKDTWDVGISLQVDLWNNLITKYQTSSAYAQLAQTEDTFASLKDAVRLEVTQNYLSVVQSTKRITLAQLSIEQADENLRITSEKFSHGLTTNSELIDAEVAQLQMKLQLTQAFVDYELAKARLQKSIGNTEAGKAE
jgi:outer membrane protein